MTPARIGRFDVIGLLGAGGIGRVYMARDRNLGRHVAIKSLHAQFVADQSFIERFRDEANILAMLSHPNITTLYDLLEIDGQIHMVMELVQGRTLENVLQTLKHLPLRDTLAVVAQTAVGLAYAHQQGFIHRDIKPSNLMLTDSGTLKIMDFGIARAQGSKRLTRQGSIVGTLFYAPPEQIRGGEGDQRSDIYSLACVAYEMLAGDPPFNADTEYGLMEAHLKAPPPPLAGGVSGVPAPIEQALLRALAKAPNDRFATAEAFSLALGAEAVQPRSAEIIRELTRKLPKAVPSSPRQVVHGPMMPAAAPARAAPAGGHIAAKPRGSRAPVYTLAGAAAAVTIGAGVLIWIETTPVSRPVNVAQMIPPPTLTPPPPPPATPKVPPIVREPMPVAADPLPPNPFMRDDPNKSKSASLPPAEPRQTLPQALERVAPMPDPPPQSRTTVQAALDVTPKLTDGIGAYSGEVVSWGFPTRIIVGSGATRTAVNLFGIVPTGNAGERADDVRKMEAFLVREGKSITCQPMLNKQYQCFINRQDLALWAINNGIAKATQDAPSEYLSVRP